jgi:hypothetical protein
MRTYLISYSRPGGFMQWPPACVTSKARIRQVAHIMFRRWFGRSPDALCWHKDGFMAECRDRRGNEILVEQHNWGTPERIRGDAMYLTPKPPLLLTWPDMKGAA